MNPLLECRDVATMRLDAVSLRVGPGEIVGVVGPAGGGKSELLALCAGHRRIVRGQVLIEGRPAAESMMRGRVGYAPDPPLIPPQVTGVDWLRYLAAHGASSPAVRDRRVRAAIELGALEAVVRLPVLTWPRSALQRLAVAAATIREPLLVLLDEPLAGHDVHAAAGVRGALARMAAQGRAILAATHDLSGLERVATRTIVVRGGRVVGDLATARLLGERMAELSLNGGALRDAGWLLSRFPGSVRTGEGVAVPLAGGRSVEEVLAACRSQRIAVAGSRVRFRALEDLLHEAAPEAR